MSLVPDLFQGDSGALSVLPLEDQIVYRVDSIRSGLAEAAFEDPKFKLKDGSVEVEFVVTREGHLSLIFDGEMKDEVTHTMKLLLGPRKTLKALQKGPDLQSKLNDRWDAAG